MRLLHLPALVLALGLSGCSYIYDIKAVAIGGRVAFIVDPRSRHGADCITQIDVIAKGGARAKPSPGDDIERVGYGTFWHQRFGIECVDEFPIIYGQTLKGTPDPLDQGPVSAKHLRIGVVYEVSTTTGATGYGGGAFRLTPDRHIENLPIASLELTSDEGNSVMSNAE
ncbi:MAG: hypothetical protein A3H25_09335 [Sphingomonadales bacterium RIFCSPLOWO2_12_FULL_63_15]|nr:MAG: hypothetical protein A3H25_09335 [Sphingomonadales bacterium RIFCSPLOWO2_12_FULL_63_15]